MRRRKPWPRSMCCSTSRVRKRPKSYPVHSRLRCCRGGGKFYERKFSWGYQGGGKPGPYPIRVENEDYIVQGRGRACPRPGNPTKICVHKTCPRPGNIVNGCVLGTISGVCELWTYCNTSSVARACACACIQI